ncbi:hypothetical protein ACHAW6_003864 [Cyclotella cf. meneghiniana]
MKRSIPSTRSKTGTYFYISNAIDKCDDASSFYVTHNNQISKGKVWLHKDPHKSKTSYTSFCLLASGAFVVYLLLCVVCFYNIPETPRVKGLVKKMQKLDRKINELVPSSMLGGRPQHVPEAVESFDKGVDACSDVAPYFNLNSKKWGLFSKKNITIEDAIILKDQLWVVIEFVMNQRGYPQPDCEEIEVLLHLKPPELLRRSEFRKYHKELSPNTTLKLLIIDASDQGLHFHEYGFPLNECIRNASDLLGPKNVYVAARALVEGRDLSQHMTFNTLFSNLNGTLLDYRKTHPGSKRRAFPEYIHNGVVAQWDFGIRTDYISIFDQIVFMKVSKKGHWPVSFDDYFAFNRKGDVCHLWNIEPQDLYGTFRNKITRTVEEVINFYNFTGVTGLVSIRDKIGRTSTSNAYAEALLDHKIVVVSQRDRWEGHFRLMEGLMSGAMIMSDPITFLPVGLADRESIVIYNSLNDLAEQIRYYLQDNEGKKERISIAKAGRKVAMEHHQPHQRYERLVLGDNFPSDWSNPVAPTINCKN